MWEGEPAFAVSLDRVVEDVVNLHDAVVGKGAVGAWDVLHRVAAPADVAGARAVFESAVGGAAAFVLHGCVVDGVVRTAGEFVHIVSDLDGKAVVQIAGEHKHALVEAVPKLDELLAFLQEHGPGVVLFDRRLRVVAAAAADVWDHEVDRGHDENEIRLAVLDAVLEPRELLFAEHGGLGVAGVVDVVQAAMGAGIEQEEIAVAHGELAVATAADRIGRAAVRFGGRVDAHLGGADHFRDLVHGGVGITGLRVELGVRHSGGRRAPVHVEISQLLVVELGEIGVRIFEDIATFLELPRAEPRLGAVFNGVGPREVIEPCARADVAEDGAAIHIADLAGAVDVIDQFVIVGCVKARHVPVPFAEIATALKVHLVVFPNTNDRRRLLHDLGRLLHRVETDLMQPALGWIIAALLVKPVAVQDGEVHLIAHLFVECVENRQGGAGTVATSAVVVAAGEFEFKIK